jgi:hypothetical protein
MDKPDRVETDPYKPPGARVSDGPLATQHAPTGLQVFQALFVSPLAVIPVSFVVSVAMNVVSSTGVGLGVGLATGVLVAMWGVIIAYLVTFLYGLLAYWILRRVGLLNLPALLGASVLPFVGLGLAFARTPEEWIFPALGMPFGAAVAFLFWYVLLGRRGRSWRSSRSSE